MAKSIKNIPPALDHEVVCEHCRTEFDADDTDLVEVRYRKEYHLYSKSITKLLIFKTHGTVYGRGYVYKIECPFCRQFFSVMPDPEKTWWLHLGHNSF